MSIYEYNEEEHMRMEREQHYEEIVAKIIEKYSLDEETAREYCK